MTRIIALLMAVLLLWQCTPAPRYHYRDEPGKKSSRSKSSTKSSQPAKKTAKTGNAPLLSINGSDSAIFTSSYYGKKFHGRKTSNGEVFNMYGYSAAHKKLPFGTVLKVTYLKTGKSVLVTVNDRGPFIEGRDLDLSYMAAKKIGLVREGVGRVKVRVVKWGSGK